MQDIQSQTSPVPLPINKVGVRALTLPIRLSDKEKGAQHTVATVDLSVDLPAEFKGTHMSRFIEAVSCWSEELNYQSLKDLLENLKVRLHASHSQAVFSFIFYRDVQAPVSKACALQGYHCKFIGELDSNNVLDFSFELIIPVMTVCPCSKAISEEGAHSQRADVHIKASLSSFLWLEDFITIAEESASSPTYPLVKREDEKFITESAFANPVFVEDLVRNVALRLNELKAVKHYEVFVESYESIHAHNAFALIKR